MTGYSEITIHYTISRGVAQLITSGWRQPVRSRVNERFGLKPAVQDISSEVSKIDVPTLVLAGELDQLDLIEQHKREVVAPIPNAQFDVIKGSGHLISFLGARTSS
jgi:pimeloyl-ACP methyl ester carboxylesterase